MKGRKTMTKRCPLSTGLLHEVRELILTARQGVARGVNAALVMLHWQVGERIRTDILKEKRAEYRPEILQTPSAKLASDFGKGFSPRNLARMISVAGEFADKKNVANLSRHLSWSHLAGLRLKNERQQQGSEPINSPKAGWENGNEGR